MSRLQRSAVSFRRQGSSGRIWDDRFYGSATEHRNAALKAAPSPVITPPALSRVASSNAGSDPSTPERNKPMRQQKPPRRCAFCVCVKPAAASRATN
jgi:Domain of unknown function (DUF4666)